MAETALGCSPSLARWRRRAEGPLLLLALGSLPFLLVELRSDDLPDADKVFLAALNGTVLIAFALDYLAGLALSSDRRRYVRTEVVVLVIVVAQFAALVPALTGFGALRALRGAPALRAAVVLLRVIAIGGAAATASRRTVRRNAGRYALSLAFLTWASAGAAFAMVEDVGVGGRYESLFDGLWWSATTVTTVGYGDVTPETFAGRLIGVITMLVGVSVFAIVTAKIAEFLVRSEDAPTAPE